MRYSVGAEFFVEADDPDEAVAIVSEAIHGLVSEDNPIDDAYAQDAMETDE